jgi:hypothetical protein
MKMQPTIEEFNALQQALEALQSQRDSLAGENWAADPVVWLFALARRRRCAGVVRGHARG